MLFLKMFLYFINCSYNCLIMDIKQIIGDKVLTIGDSYWYIDERLIKIYHIKICSGQDLNKGDVRFVDQLECFDYIKAKQEKHGIIFFNYKDEHDTTLTLNKLLHNQLRIHFIVQDGQKIELNKDKHVKYDFELESFVI
jgi:hypothetical protein